MTLSFIRLEEKEQFKVIAIMEEYFEGEYTFEETKDYIDNLIINDDLNNYNEEGIYIGADNE